jgi:polyhydroxyalkanoate synthesis regulator phasin
MDYKQTFSRMIRDGAFDKRLYHGIGHRRVWRHGVDQLRAATDRLVADGKMTPEEQKQLLSELAQRIAAKFSRYQTPGG